MSPIEDPGFLNLAPISVVVVAPIHGPSRGPGRGRARGALVVHVLYSSALRI